MDVVQFESYILVPTLQHLRLYSQEAHELVLGTCVQESDGLKYIRQLGGGPALGPGQVEPASHDRLYSNFLIYQPHLLALVKEIEPSCKSDAMLWNLRYSVAMCRIFYRAVQAPLPKAGDLQAQAAYWKKYYNTALGKGKPEQYVRNWNRYVRKMAEAG